MTTSQHENLRELLRRVDEVRGLSERPDPVDPPDPADHGALLTTLGELVEELERSHRRLIETNVQLVSLREVASGMVNTLDVGETTRTVTRYLAHAFGFEEVFLLLLDREKRRLEGAWTRGAGHDQTLAVDLGLLGDQGAVSRALWLNRTIVHHAARHHPPALLPEGHALQETLARLGSVVCIPLQRSHALLPADHTHELCGARCMMGDASLLAPPPGPAAAAWAATREERQAHCLGCEFMPMLGVLGVARAGNARGAASYTTAEVTMLESIALSVAPVVENATLTQELRRSERFREHVVDSMASALVAVNMKGEVLTFNRAAEDLLGFRQAEVLGRPLGELVGPDGEHALHATLEHGREALREELHLRAQDGTPVPVSLSTSLLRNERRAIYGAIATFVDLTPLKRAEEQARRLDRLAALGRFTSSVAHEIRNPLTGIAAGVQYLARGMQAADPQRENLDFILNEIRRLDRIVQDLFDITHPRGLNLLVRPVEETARRALQCLDALLAERGVSASLEVTPRTPPVPHDPDQLQQVLINLVKNAAEASPQGAAIVMRVLPAPPAPRRRGRAPAPPAIHVQVEDRGCGIPLEAQQRLFEPFYTTKPGGTGLGLYITHDIVKRHGGRLLVHSETGRGTTFTVELPLENQGGNP